MSNEAINWALAQRLDRSSAKFVLVAMANCANAEMVCWPAMQYLVDATSQDRKTVLANVARLVELGMIVPTGEKMGRTGQVAVYALNVTPKEYQKRDALPEVETVPKTDTKSPVFPTNSPVFPVEESRFSVETVPKTGHGTIKEPTKEPKKKKEKSAPQSVAVSVLVEAGFDEAVAAEFIACKADRDAPLTPRAWKDHVREAAKAGWTPLEAAEKVMAKTWKGFEAKYVANDNPPSRTNGHHVPYLTAKERDTAAAAERFRLMTGGILNGERKSPFTGDIFDMEETRAPQIANG